MTLFFAAAGRFGDSDDLGELADAFFFFEALVFLGAESAAAALANSAWPIAPRRSTQRPVSGLTILLAGIFFLEEEEREDDMTEMLLLWLSRVIGWFAILKKEFFHIQLRIFMNQKLVGRERQTALSAHVFVCFP
jgi:hypothetical protein